MIYIIALISIFSDPVLTDSMLPKKAKFAQKDTPKKDQSEKKNDVNKMLANVVRISTKDNEQQRKPVKLKRKLSKS